MCVTTFHSTTFWTHLLLTLIRADKRCLRREESGRRTCLVCEKLVALECSGAVVVYQESHMSSWLHSIFNQELLQIINRTVSSNRPSTRYTLHQISVYQTTWTIPCIQLLNHREQPVDVWRSVQLQDRTPSFQLQQSFWGRLSVNQLI